MQPAHLTKHIPLLSYPFASSVFLLAQLSDGVSNGTALWLGGQCLALYLAQFHAKFKPANSSRPPRAIELGSGIGLTALALASLGWDVLATDISHVISSVLDKNIKNNLSALPIGSGRVQIRELDWCVPQEKWAWDHELAIASHNELPSPVAHSSELLCPPFDLIFSADTVYSMELVRPMLATLHSLSRLSTSHPASTHFPPILLCIERRDPPLVDHLLNDAKDKWNFRVERIPHRKFVKIVEKSTHWNRSEWDDVELWRLQLHET
ncbi:hypothetical protein M413DRAFT_15360 [Hebeloma cylindrosporum]|uniref:Uncharacterized protein n=1 Tax=Hebeloma cylindrosporum TaxID=76867 RepID=A0A0C2Z7U9_HEBCY|nr:hypothetical protein M413DRAFT_15360 [Hebeloma cylindrosporum h7]